MTASDTSRDSAARELARCREEIERIDGALVELLAQRVRLGRTIGVVKRTLGLPTIDPAREAEVIRRAATRGRDAGLPEEAIRAIFWQVIGLSRQAQAIAD